MRLRRGCDEVATRLRNVATRVRRVCDEVATRLRRGCDKLLSWTWFWYWCWYSETVVTDRQTEGDREGGKDRHKP